jgi:hypothetical protein
MANPEHKDNWKNCDFCWLEMRKICEYLALSLVLAHQCDTGQIEDLTKWRPKDLLAQVAKINDHPTPIQIAVDFKADSNGENQLVPIFGPIAPELISKIYGRCSDLLHLGSLDRILSGKMPSHDIREMQIWVSGLQKLFMNHVVFLPGIKKVLLCLTRGEQTNLHILASDGAIFDKSSLPEFDFQVQ